MLMKALAALAAPMVVAVVGCSSRNVIVCETLGGRGRPDRIEVETDSGVARHVSFADNVRAERIVTSDGFYEITFPTVPGALRLYFKIDRQTGKGDRELGNDPPGSEATLRQTVRCSGGPLT